MTKEEKLKKAEEKARRKAEIAEEKMQRKIQLAALKNYWWLLRYDISSRSCPKEFFLFWARPLIFVMPYVFLALLHFFDWIHGLVIMSVLLIILYFVFPIIVTWFVSISVLCFVIGLVLMITGILFYCAGILPVILSAVKRRINDVSRAASEAHVRFVLFAGTGALSVVSVCLCGLSWLEISVLKEGVLSWMPGLSTPLAILGFVFLVCQVYHYSFVAGVKGENFAGPNPIETPLTESYLVARSSQLGSRFWHILSFVLIGFAAVISFALSHTVCQWIYKFSLFAEMREIMGVLTFSIYGVQLFIAVLLVLFACVKSRVTEGDLCTLELDSINSCFKPKVAEVTDDLLRQASLPVDEEKTSSSYGAGSILGLIVRLHGVVFRITFYLAAVQLPLFGGLVVFALIVHKPIIGGAIIALCLAAIFGLNYIRFKDEGGDVNHGFKKAREAMFDQLRSCGLSAGVAIVAYEKWALRKLWECFSPASFATKANDSTAMPSGSIPSVKKKRERMMTLSFVDPVGIHQLIMRQREMGGIQVLVCLTFFGILVSWLWSILDGIRFARMSDEAFLLAYPDYCVSHGFKDWLKGKRYRPNNNLP